MGILDKVLADSSVEAGSPLPKGAGMEEDFLPPVEISGLFPPTIWDLEENEGDRHWKEGDYVRSPYEGGTVMKLISLQPGDGAWWTVECVQFRNPEYSQLIGAEVKIRQRGSGTTLLTELEKMGIPNAPAYRDPQEWHVGDTIVFASRETHAETMYRITEQRGPYSFRCESIVSYQGSEFKSVTFMSIGGYVKKVY